MSTRNTKKEYKNLWKIVSILKNTPGGLWIREIARRSNLHMEIVRRIMNKYPALFEEYADFTSYKINLKIIKLRRPNITQRELINYVKLKKME